MTSLWRVFAFLTPFRWRVASSAGLSALAVASNVGLLAMAGYLLASTATGQPLVLLTFPIYVVRLLAISRAAARYAERISAHDVTFRILTRIRLWVYDRLATFGPLFPWGFHSGDAVTRFVKDVDDLQNLYLQTFSPVTTALVLSTLVAVALYTVSTTLTYIVLLYLSLSGIVLPLAGAYLLRGRRVRQVEQRGNLAMLLIDIIQGSQDIALAGRISEFLARATALDRSLGEMERHAGGVNALRVAGNDLLANLAMWASMVVLIPLVAHGSASRVSLPVVAFMVLAVFEVTQSLGVALQSLDTVRASANRIFAVTDAEPPVISPPRPLPRPSSTRLIFDHVSFAYAPDGPACISDINFDVSPGERLAIVGPSGAGKTTLARLAVRMIDPVGGQVLLGGNSVSRYRLDDVRSLISVAGQGTHVFNDTIRGNLRLGFPPATDLEMWQALEIARLRETVERMPRQLDCWVGEGGALLSGGERQRLGLARSFLRRTPILILDEPTANLDPLTERELLDALDTLTPAPAMVYITHRLVGMESMDEILVLDRGQVVERGRHAGLQRCDGLYRRMMDTQDGLLAME